MSDSYLVKRNSIFYFRYRIPHRLNEIVNVREFKISLNTPDRRVARLRSSQVYIAVMIGLNLAAKGQSGTLETVRTYFKSKFHDHFEIDQDNHTITTIFDISHQKLNTVNKEKKLTDNEKNKRTKRAANKSKKQHSQISVKNYTIRQVFEDLKIKNTDNRTSTWKVETVKDYEDTCNLYVDYLSENKPISKISIDEHLNFAKILMIIPSNRNKKEKYRNKSISEIINDPPPIEDRMSLATINSHITRLNALINHLKKEVAVHLPTISKIKSNKKIQERDARKTFTDNDLIKIFNHKNYQARKLKHDYYYWLIPISLYTGARLRELCQLETKDIQFDNESGIYYIDINENLSEDLKGSGIIKSLKNISSDRIVPIHSHLIELGFIEFVEGRSNSTKSNFLFNLTPNINGDCSVSVSKWFQRYKKNIDFESDKDKKVFHSFRHTFIDTLKQKDVSDENLADIVGHSHKSSMNKFYRKSIRLIKSKNIIEMLNYRDVIPRKKYNPKRT